MTEAMQKALDRLGDLKRKGPGIRKALAAFHNNAIKHGALDAPIDYEAAQELHDKLEDYRSTLQLLLYNLQAVGRDKPT